MNDDPEEIIAALLAPRAASDSVRYPPAESDALLRVREAIDSDRPIIVYWPGQVVEDVDGVPTAMTEARIIHPGEADPVPGEWRFDDDAEEPTISPCE